MAEESAQPEFKIFWTWSSPKKGWLSTMIKSDGTVRQIRQYSPSTEPAADKLGHVPADRARCVYNLASAACATEKGGVSAGSADNPPPETESVELQLVDVNGERTVHMPFAELAQHPEMTRLRKAVIASRNHTNAWASLWYNVGGRVGAVFVLLLGYICYLTLGGRMTLDRLQKDAQRIDARVLTRSGASGFDKNKFITVRIVPPNGSQAKDIKVDEYLSADNWKAAAPGSTARVWYLPQKSSAYLENDVLRNIEDEKGSWMAGWGFPLLLTCIMAPIIWFLSRYRAGTHLDGKEYILHDERVVLDGKALPFGPLQLLAVRGLIRLVE